MFELVPAARTTLLDNIFNEVFQPTRQAWPALDLYEENDKYVAKVEAPGLSKDNFNITVDNGVLSIACTYEQKKDIKDRNYIYAEIRKGSFKRSLTLPKDVDMSSISAKYEDGILTITLPKQEHKDNSVHIAIE